MFVHGDSGKMPFEDKVIAYLKAPSAGNTVEDCAHSIGISAAAVYAVLADLEARGVVKYPAETEEKS